MALLGLRTANAEAEKYHGLGSPLLISSATHYTAGQDYELTDHPGKWRCYGSADTGASLYMSLFKRIS
jgi:hypothetical protein